MANDWLRILNHDVVSCTRCPRLVTYREEIARVKRRAYLDWEYWGKPVPGFGDPQARVLIMGLAPGAHGSNRTGRPFTGDASGAFMYPVLYEAGFANQPTATDRNDGLKLKDLYITAAVRCPRLITNRYQPNSWRAPSFSTATRRLREGQGHSRAGQDRIRSGSQLRETSRAD